MKKVVALVVAVALLGALGVAAYKLGWLNRVAFVAGGAPAATSAATASGTGATPGAPAGETTPAPGSPIESAFGDQPGAPTGAAATQVAVGAPGQPVANKAIELRVTNVRTAASLGDHTAAAGREFVIVDTAWKNLLQPQRVNRKAAGDRTQGAGGLGFGGGTTAEQRAEDEANTTTESVTFRASPLTEHLWLVVDGHIAEAIDTEATDAIDGHLPTETLEIAKFQEVRSGGVAFQAPANAQSLALLFLDSNHGHMLVAAKGAPPRLGGGLGGSARGNGIADVMVTGTSWADAPDSPGMRTLVLNMRGISRKDAIAEMPFEEFGFLQTDEGCIAQPEEHSAAVTRSLAPVGRFLPLVPTEGQLAFTVPASTRAATFLFRASGSKPIDLSVLGNAAPQKPAARASFQDGSILRVSVVGTAAPPASFGAPPGGSEHLVVDYVVENLQTGQGLELQPDPQFALATGAGETHPPEADSANLPCRLTGAGVVPAGGWRRFSLLYTVPAGQPLSLKYRGFEQEGTLKVR